MKKRTEKTMRETRCFRLCAFAVLLAVLLSGCSFFKGKGTAPEKEAPKPKKDIQSLAVIGFLPAQRPGDEPGMVRNQLSGSVQMCHPVSPKVVDTMTSMLFEKLSAAPHEYTLISPEQVKELFGTRLSTNPIIGDVDQLLKVAHEFSADAVLVGYIYQWKELEGSDYAARQPASVSFDLYMVESGVGAILWKGNYDKTQRSLSENILDRMTFLRAGGKWLSAEQLAKLGLEDLIAKLPKGKKAKEG